MSDVEDMLYAEVKELKAYVLKLDAKLKRYEEREPLVQALLRVALTQDAVENFEELVDKRASAVRDFKLDDERTRVPVTIIKVT